MIKKEGSKYVLYSKDGSKKLGTFDSEKEAEEREGEINRIKHAKAEITLTITKASLQEDGTMRWAAVTSDTNEDRTGERTSLGLFQDWIERAERGKGAVFLPRPRIPFLGISHYPDMNGQGEAGATEKMYIDGEQFKASGNFYANIPIGKALFEAVREEQSLIKRGEAIEEPIRISAAWWDLAHSHGDFVFERKNLSDHCPMCERGAGDKVYLKGQLDHFAATRVPMNPRTSLELLEEKSMLKTKKEDAASIIGEELAEELDKAARTPLGKAESDTVDGMVIKADEEQPETVKMEDEMEHMPFGGAMSMAEARSYMEGQRQAGEVYSQWAMYSTVMNNIMDQSEPGEMKARVTALTNEFSDSVAAIKAAVEDAYLVEPVSKGDVPMTDQTKAQRLEDYGVKIQEILADTTLDRAQKSAAIQEQLNGMGNVVKAQLDAVAPPSVEEAIQKSMAPIVEQLGLIVAKLGGQVQQPAQPMVMPQQKSFAPAGQPNTGGQQSLPVSPVTGQPSSLTAMIRRSAGIQ